jgi:hypothetical protein
MVPLSEISDPKNDFNLNLPRYIDSERARGPPGHRRPPTRRHPRPRPRRARARTGRSSRACGRRCSRRPTAPATPSSRSPLRTSRAPSSARRVHGLEHADQEALRQVASARRRHGSTRSRRATSPRPSSRRWPRSCWHVPEGQAHRRLRRLPAPHGLLGRDHAGRRLPDRERRLARGRQAPVDVEDKDKKSKDKPDFTIGKQKFKAELIPMRCSSPATSRPSRPPSRSWSRRPRRRPGHGGTAEEHGGEDGLLAEARNDKDKLTKASVAARLKEIKATDAADERKVLGDYLALVEKESSISEKAKAAHRNSLRRSWPSTAS